MGAGLRALLDLVLPVECGGCGAAGAPWCPRCAASLGPPVRVYPPACPARPPVYALGSYRGPLRTAVLAFKERGRRDLAAPLAAALAAALAEWQAAGPAGPGPRLPPGGWCLVPAPSRWSAVARRGGPHLALLAARTAALLAASGCPATVAPALRMARGVRDSVGLDERTRRANLAGRVLVRRAGLPTPGVAAVLVDDVVTTGATIAACTTALRQVGIEVPAIVVLASADRHLRRVEPPGRTTVRVDGAEQSAGALVSAPPSDYGPGFSPDRRVQGRRREGHAPGAGGRVRFRAGDPPAGGSPW